METNLFMSGSTETLIPKSPARQRRDSLLYSAKNNMIQPNEFFGSIQTPDDNESTDSVSRAMSIDFGPSGPPENLDQAFFQTEEEEIVFDPMLNIYKPDFATRMRLYLKPQDGSLSIMLILLMTDTVLSITYICA